MRRLRQIGPRPVALAGYLGHHAFRRVRSRLLPSVYGRVVAEPRSDAALILPEIAIPPAERLPEQLRPAAERIRAEADDALAHRFAVLDSGPVELGPEIDWHLDFKSGHRWPAEPFGKVVGSRLDDDSDVRVPWELSRSHHLVTLARAACLFQDERYAAEVEAQLGSWLDANPPGVGVNWINPMEVGLRAVNWIWAIGTLRGFRDLDPELERRVTRSLQSHLRHIVTNFEGSPYLRSNHYLADILGVIALGAVLRDDPWAARWFRFARWDFARQMRKQVLPDGMSFEASLPYHGLALEMFLIAAHLAAWRGAALTQAYQERLRRMLDLSRAVRHPNGRLPLIGDGDSGRVLPAGVDRPPTHDNLIWLGAAIATGERPLEGDPHEEVAWTLGLEAWERCSKLGPRAPQAPAAFPDGGVYVLRGAGTHAVVRCAGVGQNGNGGHAHNDVLSFELSMGAPLVVDPGTYAYTSDPAARNEFRSTRAHNTVVVDGEEINPIAERELFRLHGIATPRVESWVEEPARVCLAGSHDGYRRLAEPVTHRRMLELDRATGALTVSDALEGRGSHRAESFLHLAPGTEVERLDATRLRLRNGGSTAEVDFDGAGEVEVGEGWVSDRFGRRERAPVVTARLDTELPATFGYSLTPVPAGARAGADFAEAVA